MASISKLSHSGVLFNKIFFSSNTAAQKTGRLLKRHFMGTPPYEQRGSTYEDLRNAFVLIAEERDFSQTGLLKVGDPEVLSYEEFKETVETYEEFLCQPHVKNRLEKNPLLDPYQLYEHACHARYERHKIFFYTCKLLWKNTERSADVSRESDSIYSQYSALIQALDLTGISYAPHF